MSARYLIDRGRGMLTSKPFKGSNMRGIERIGQVPSHRLLQYVGPLTTLIRLTSAKARSDYGLVVGKAEGVGKQEFKPAPSSFMIVMRFEANDTLAARDPDR